MQLDHILVEFYLIYFYLPIEMIYILSIYKHYHPDQVERQDQQNTHKQGHGVEINQS
jgi:hypothetical protein